MAARRLIDLAALAAGAGAALPISAAATSLRQWLVYFEFDSTAYAGEPGTPQRFIREFADFARETNVSRIVVVGHTDRAGTEPYNTELSLRRAETIAEELKRLGLEARLISVQAKGEAEPAVPTADGVPEQLNRRAEIVWLK